jgi:hypothetical protein
MFQPLIIDNKFEYVLNITMRELGHVQWSTSKLGVATVQGVTLVVSASSVFQKFWMKKFVLSGSPPAAFTSKDIENLRKDLEY